MSKFIADVCTDKILTLMKADVMLWAALETIPKKDVKKLREKIHQIINDQLKQKRSFLESAAEQMEVDE